MANQIIIDIGAVANDGTGDPLRTAFNYVNNNFSNIWTTGVANSNISFSGNKILTTNTNGNLVLAPNGIGKVQANVDIVPNANNTLSLGSLALKWNTIYAQNLDVGGNVEFNDLTVDGNLTVTGNIIQIGNIVTDSKTIQLANTASTANAANGSGITVGANDDIATMLYSSTSNVWTTNIGISATGNITGTYFVGNGSLLTGITSTYGNSNVAEYLASGTNTSNISTTGSMSAQGISIGNVFTANGVFGEFGAFTGGSGRGLNSIQAGVGTFTFLGSDVIGQFTGNSNAYTQFNFQNIGNGTQASGDYVITADNGNDTTHFLNIGITSSNWNGTQPNSLGNRLGPNDGYLYVQDGDMVIGTSNGNIETWKFDQTGNLTVPGDILPLANNTQTLGNNTNRWSNLYLSGNTIYLGDLSLSAGADGLTSTTGFDLANSTAANIEATGNITANYFLGNIEGLIGNITNLNSVNFAVENIGALIGNNGVNIGAGGNNNLVVLPDEVLIQNVPLTVAGNIRSTVAGGLNITANTVANGVAQTWNFGTDGDLTVPGNIVSGNARISLQEPSFDSVYITPVTDDTTSITLDPSGIALNSAVGMTVSANTAGNVIAWSFNDEGAFGLPYGGTLDNNSENDVELRSTNNINFEANAVVNIYTDTSGTAYQWQFDDTGNLTLPGGGSIIVDGGDGVIGPDGDNMVISWDNEDLILRSVGSDVDVEADRDFNIRVNYDVGATDYLTKWIFGQDNEIVNITGNSAIVTEAGNLNLQGGRNTLSSGNVQITAVDNGVAVNTWLFDNAGVLTAPGNITTTGNISAQNFTGNISITGNVTGTSANVDLVAGGNTWSFNNTGNLVLPGNTFAVNYANGTPVDVVTRFEGAWTVTAGTNNYSFTVDSSNTYQMWVEGNIANGIIAWNALATITNTNVPVIGQQFAWNYEGAGNPIVFTSIPAQIIGTAGAISNASPVVANTNVFTFGINNTSGSDQTVRYGWIKIS